MESNVKKIAIFHNFMDNIGGAEMVGLILARELKADLYTTNVDFDKIAKMGFSDINIISIGNIPLNAPFRQQMALWKFRRLNLKSQYDFFIIDGDWAMSGAVKNKPNIWYVHSPIREIWDLYKETRQNTVPWFARYVFDGWVMLNRVLNKKYVEHVDTLVCNSVNTKNRVNKFLNKDAQVIHPPIQTNKYFYRKNGDYWLSVNRLISHKRVEMQIEAFKKLPDEKLIIVGSYEKSTHFTRYAKHIENIRPDNVEIISWVTFDELIELYADCKGFITTAYNEDFGMTPVEAMASGKPVIASNEGGYKETVVDGVTGILIDDIDSNKLLKAIRELSDTAHTYKEACLRRAKEFDVQVFIDEIKKVVYGK